MPDVDVRPVNAGGVPSFLLTPPVADQDTVMLFLHGGAYVSGSAFGYRGLAGALAAAARATVLVPEYRLAPEHPYPAALEDAERAYLWLLDSATSPQQVCVAGDSAGAGLAMSLLINLSQQAIPLPGSAVLLSPWLDLRRETIVQSRAEHTSGESNEIDYSVAVEAYLAGHPPDDPVVDPLGADLSHLPPLLIQTASGDPIVDQARRLADRARAHGVAADLVIYPVDIHAFQLFWHLLPEAEDAVRQAGNFIRSVHRGWEPNTPERGCGRA